MKPVADFVKRGCFQPANRPRKGAAQLKPFLPQKFGQVQPR